MAERSDLSRKDYNSLVVRRGSLFAKCAKGKFHCFGCSVFSVACCRKAIVRLYQELKSE